MKCIIQNYITEIFLKSYYVASKGRKLSKILNKLVQRKLQENNLRN